jgi:predicted ArsR family transcriptional regulator
MAKPTTRLRLLRLLKLRGPLSAAELAAALGVTAVAVRKHLDLLHAEGALRAERIHQPIGRPVARYHLTPAAESYFPRGHHALLLDLLAAIDREDPAAVDRLLETCSVAQQPRYRARLADKPPAERVAELARLREEDGFLTSVQRDGDALVLREHHCPIRDVAERYPAACRCEQELFGSLLGLSVERTESALQGAPACAFRISLGAERRADEQ